MIYSLQFTWAMQSRLSPPRLIFDGEIEAEEEAERLLRQAGIAFTLVSDTGARMFVDGQGRMLVRVVCHVH